MLSIIAHHMVVNSGIMELFDYSKISGNMVFLYLYGMWGKTAINCFVMITGYYMSKSKLTIRRYAKIYLEAKFYRILMFLIFALTGYEMLSGSNVLKMLFGIASGGNNGFTESFLLMYLFIPYLNLIADKFDRTSMRSLILLLVFAFTVKSTLFLNTSMFNEVFWYMTVYLIGAYLRLYEPEWTISQKKVGSCLLACAVMAAASVLFMIKFGNILWFLNRYFLVVDSDKILALCIGVLAFLFFRNLKIQNSKWINLIASTTFGVFCIHASSDAMRKFLWLDFLKIPSIYVRPTWYVIAYCTAATVGVFVFCSLLDLIRLRLIEPPVMRFICGKEKDWTDKLQSLIKIKDNSAAR